jgi:hypothetical protein
VQRLKNVSKFFIKNKKGKYELKSDKIRKENCIKKEFESKCIRIVKMKLML